MRPAVSTDAYVSWDGVLTNAVYFASWAGVTGVTLFAAFYLPKLIQALPIAEDNLYQPAWQVYDVASTHFDNTAFTYATDYGLAVFMAFGALYTHRCAPSTLRDRTCSLLTCMCVSVLVGVSRVRTRNQTDSAPSQSS